MQRPGDWSHDRLMLSTIVNLERMASRTASPDSASASASDILQGSFMPAER